MKKFIVFLTIVSLIFAAVPTTLGAKPTTDTLRVGLYYGSTAKTSYSITSESGFSVGTETDRIYTEQFTMSDTSLTITMGSDGIATFGDRTFDCNNIRLTFKPAGDSSIAVDGNKYRGGLEFLHAGEGKIAVINLVLADEYVYGVTGKEMSASWHLEALKAQSVCARNYALASLNKHSTYGFDVCTTTDCQVYGGIDAEHTNTIRAGMETAGKYLMYNGRLAETLFFSCSGGHTANAKYVWGNEIPYFPGVADPYENPEEAARYNWSNVYTLQQIQDRLVSTGVNIGNIVDIKTTADPTSGYVYELTITGTNGSHTYKNEKTRTWMGWNMLYSQRYTVTPVYGQMAEIAAITSNGTQAAQGYTAITGKGELLNSNMPVTMLSSTQTATITSDVIAYQFDGHGWGHGVGMSQYGAKGMADQGFTFEQILSFYYPGTYLE